MKEIRKTWGAVVLLLLGMALSLSGCSVPRLTLDPQDLYTLPTLPVKYTELNTQLQTILEGGAEYAAPTSGTNIQPVQLVDLDGDGREEAVAFFRRSNDEKPLKIYIFTATEDSYQQTELIEGSGTAIYSVAYEDLNGDGIKELAVGWKATPELQVLELYRLYGDSAEILVRTNYVKYTIADLNRDQRQEVIVLRSDEEGMGMADYYNWQQDDRFARQSSARISMTMAELSQHGRVTKGILREEVPALFITGVTDTSRAITDILAVRNGELSNVVLSQVTGVSSQIAPYTSLYPQDINGDGLSEVPWSVQLMSPGSESLSYQRVDWYNYNISGEAAITLQTYHNMDDRWYFRLPESWVNRVWISRSAISGEATVTFFILKDSGRQMEPFLRISAMTGANREIQAMRGEWFLLSRQQETIYAAELLEANKNWKHGMTADQVRQAFSLIATEWTAGDN